VNCELTISLSEIVGLKLDAASAALAGSTPGVALRIVETSAPLRQNSEHTFGERRVLRARFLENSEQPTIELTLARELLEHAPREARQFSPESA
jgi:hypothetical protein